jgi:small ligand-binding sensory domain FIST
VRFVAALSAHPLAAHAAGEVVGRVLEQLSEPIDVAVLVVSGSHVHQLEQIAGVVRATLSPRWFIGASATGVLAGEHEIIEQPAIALWVGVLADAAAVHLRMPGTGAGPDLGSGAEVTGLDPDLVEQSSTLVLLAGPSFPLEAAMSAIAARHPGLDVAGGVVAAGVRPSDNKLLCGDEVATGGAVGLLLGPEAAASVIVSRGFRPIGVPLVVTEADGAVIRGLAGRPILDRLDELLLGLDEAEAAAVSRGLHLGQVVDEHQTSFGPGDFAVRHVADVDRAARSLTVVQPHEHPVEVGTTVQFLVRDATGADQDLRAQLAGHRARGALAFVSVERGPSLLTEPDHDAELVSTIVDGQANAGAICSAVFTSTGSPLVDEGPTAVVVLVESDPPVL